jgi:hypothetical protein
VTELLRKVASFVAGAALLAVGSAVAASPSRAIPGPMHQTAMAADRPLVGTEFHGTWDVFRRGEKAELLSKLKRNGVRWVRIGIPWAMVQPRKPTASDPGWNTSWGLPRIDHAISMAHRRGLKVTGVIARTPSWANGGRGPTVLPTSTRTFARVVRFLAHRYRGKVDSWEIWNEENNDNFLQGATVGEYTRLLCAAYPAVHRGNPHAKVVYGGTSGNDWRWIKRSYHAGAKPCFDVMATHPYNGPYPPSYQPPNNKPPWFNNIKLVRRVMVGHRDAGKHVWFTEVGWSSHRNSPGMPSWMQGVSRKQQAAYLVQMLKITAARYPYVTRVSWYSSRNESTSNVENNHFGLFTIRLHPKPVVAALRKYTHG